MTGVKYIIPKEIINIISDFYIDSKPYWINIINSINHKIIIDNTTNLIKPPNVLYIIQKYIMETIEHKHLNYYEIHIDNCKKIIKFNIKIKFNKSIDIKKISLIMKNISNKFALITWDYNASAYAPSYYPDSFIDPRPWGYASCTFYVKEI